MVLVCARLHDVDKSFDIRLIQQATPKNECHIERIPDAADAATKSTMLGKLCVLSLSVSNSEKEICCDERKHRSCRLANGHYGDYVLTN